MPMPTSGIANVAVLGGDAHIAGKCKFEAGADRVAFDAGDHGLGEQFEATEGQSIGSRTRVPGSCRRR